MSLEHRSETRRNDCVANRDTCYPNRSAAGLGSFDILPKLVWGKTSRAQRERCVFGVKQGGACVCRPMVSEETLRT